MVIIPRSVKIVKIFFKKGAAMQAKTRIHISFIFAYPFDI